MYQPFPADVPARWLHNVTPRFKQVGTLKGAFYAPVGMAPATTVSLWEC